MSDASGSHSLKLEFADKGLEKRVRTLTRWDILGESPRPRSCEPRTHNRQIELQSRVVMGKQQSLVAFFKYYLR